MIDNALPELEALGGFEALWDEHLSELREYALHPQEETLAEIRQIEAGLDKNLADYAKTAGQQVDEKEFVEDRQCSSSCFVALGMVDRQVGGTPDPACA